MKHTRRFFSSLLLIGLLSTMVAGCDQSGSNQASQAAPSMSTDPRPDFVVCATGEAKLISEVVTSLGNEKAVKAVVRILPGTFDVLNEVRDPDRSSCHAVIVSSSSWLDLNVSVGALKDRVSLMRTQLVVGLTDEAVIKAKLPKGAGKNVLSPSELMKLISSGALKLAVPATSSNGGVSFLLLATSAFAGEPDSLTKEQVEDPLIVQKNKEVMSKVLVRGGSSELKNWILANPQEVDGMVNYAGVIAQHNSEAASIPGAKPLQVYYISPTYQADVPISYVVKKSDSPERYQFYRDLLVRLMSADVQRSLYKGGYHPASLELASEVAPVDFFKPAWGFDPAVEENLAYFLIPDNSQLLAFVQRSYEAYRKAAFVGLVVDFSGSMDDPMGPGDNTLRIKRLREALAFLLNDDLMASVGLPYRNGPGGDLVFFVPFSAKVIPMNVSSLANSSESRLNVLKWADDTNPGGRTALYWGVRDALRAYQNQAATAENRAALSCTIVLLTDGEANVGSPADMFEGVNNATRDLCVVYAIGIGEANPEQLKAVVRPFEGQVIKYSGGDSLTGVMRRAFGATR